MTTGLALAMDVLVIRGAATAVTAEADRNVRRVVERLRPGTSLLAILRINDVCVLMSMPLPSCGKGRWPGAACGCPLRRECRWPGVACAA